VTGPAPNAGPLVRAAAAGAAAAGGVPPAASGSAPITAPGAPVTAPPGAPVAQPGASTAAPTATTAPVQPANAAAPVIDPTASTPTASTPAAAPAAPQPPVAAAAPVDPALSPAQQAQADYLRDARTARKAAIEALKGNVGEQGKAVALHSRMNLLDDLLADPKHRAAAPAEQLAEFVKRLRRKGYRHTVPSAEEMEHVARHAAAGNPPTAPTGGPDAVSPPAETGGGQPAGTPDRQPGTVDQAGQPGAAGTVPPVVDAASGTATALSQMAGGGEIQSAAMEPGQQSRDAIDDVLATDAAERHHGDGLSFDASATTLSPYQKRVPLVQDYYSPR
jgi:hypothetical protein